MKTNLFFNKIAIIVIFLTGMLTTAYSQNVAITDDETYEANAAAMLDIKSTNKGMLIPRVALVSTTNPISVTKPDGLLIWNSLDGNYSVGYYYWSSTVGQWQPVGAAVGNGLTLSGSKIELGGALDKATTITTGANQMEYSVGTGLFKIDLTSTGDFDIQDNGSSAFFVRDNGNVGVGTNIPIADLHIVGSSTIGSLLVAPSIGSGGDAEIFLAEDNDKTMGMSWKYDGGNNEMYLFGKSGSTTYGPHMTINRNDGKVGIGTTAPGALLDVSGDLLLYRGVAINEFSSDGNLSGNSNSAVPTERAVRTYVNNNAGAGHTGSGTVNYIPRWTSSTGLGNSILYQNSNQIGIGTDAPTSKLVVYGNNGQTDDDAIFEVKNNAGQTVFAVYPKGVRINVDSSVIAGKAVGSRGGFAVGNLAAGKDNEEFFRVTRDSIRININEDGSKAVGSRGGFAVGNLAVGKSGGQSLMQLRKENYFIGHDAGIKTTGIYNSFFGYYSGKNNTTGYNNVFMGYYSGLNNEGGGNNVFIGNSAGRYNTDGQSNTFIGNYSGYKNEEGDYNVFIGKYTGYQNSTGSNNVFLGLLTGRYNKTGNDNIYIGNWAGYGNSSGSGAYSNTFLGVKSGQHISSGHNNCLIGYYAGCKITDGYSNVAIGDSAGYKMTTGNQNTMIGSGTGVETSTAGANTYVGYWAGIYMNGGSNTFVGTKTGGAGHSTTIGTGGSNTALGAYSLYKVTSGAYNAILGGSAGRDLSTGSKNTFLGTFAGGGYLKMSPFHYYSGNNGSNNVFIGYSAGRGSTFSALSNTLVIHNNYVTSIDDVLIYGSFSSKYVNINGTLYAKRDMSVGGGSAEYSSSAEYIKIAAQKDNWYVGVRNETTQSATDFYIGLNSYETGAKLMIENDGSVKIGSTAATTYRLRVTGNVYSTGSYYHSDLRMKKDINTISSALSKLDKIRGVYFDWNTEVIKNMRKSEVTDNQDDLGNEQVEQVEQVEQDIQTEFPETQQIGVIAQEVEEVVPEAVYTDSDGLKAVDYAKLVPLLIQAIKEQQQQIDELKAVIGGK